MNNRLEEERLFEENENIRAPWARGFGGRHRTRKHCRSMKKRKATRRRT